MRNVETVYRLSPLQESLLYHALADGGSRVGFEQSHTTLDGPLDVELLERTWREAVTRHPILRTAFVHERLERPVQVVRRRVELPIEHHDWRGLPKAGRREALATLLRRDRERGFDPQRAPLTRLALCRMEEDSHVLVWSYHHLLLDGWARESLLEEIFSAYVARRRGETPGRLERPPFQAYVAWLDRRDPEAAADFWVELFEARGGPVPLVFGDRPEGWRSDRGAAPVERRTVLDEEESAALAGFARRYRLTVGTVVHGAWALLLSAYTGSPEVVLGITVAGRPADLPGSETILGPLSNNLPVPVTVAPDALLVPWLESLQQRLSAVAERGWCPPAQIQEWTGRAGARRMFDTLLLFQNYRTANVGDALRTGDLALRPHRAELRTAFPVTVLSEPRRRIPLEIHVDGSRAEDESVGRMLERLRTLLLEMAARPGARLAELAPTAEEDRERPQPETDSLRVLDRLGRPAAVGLPGELARSGPGDLRRLGVAARHLPGGRVESLGALEPERLRDGLRPGEVAAVLRRHPAVARAFVDPEPERGAPAAYLAAEEGAEPDPEELERWLRQALPELTSPLEMVLVPENALPDPLDRPEAGRPDLAHLRALRPVRDRATPPATPVEEVLHGHLTELLDVSAVAVDRNLFDLGIQSLVAARFIARVRRSFGVEVPLRSLFEEPTITGVAARVEAALRGGRRDDDAPIEPRPKDVPRIPSHAQERLWFMYRLEPASPAYNMPRALRLRGDLRLPALARTLREIARRHEVLRTRFVEHRGTPAPVVDTPPERLPLVDLTGLAEASREAEARRVAARLARRPFALESDPPLRVAVLRLGCRDHGLVAVLHHIASDGWSMGVLVRELRTLYDAFSRGVASPLDEPPIQYADFAAWQAERFAAGLRERQLGYWRERLRGAPPVSDLPIDHRRPVHRSFEGDDVRFQIGPETGRSLDALCRRERVTLFVALTAAFHAFLHRSTGATDLVVGIDVANRVRPELEALIGFFVNNLAIRLDLSGNPTFRELLQRAQEVAFGAFAHQDLPFEELVRELRPERGEGRAPLFQLLLVLQDAPEEELELPGLDLEPLELRHGTAKFDLALFLWRSGDRLHGRWNYATELFEQRTVERFADRFSRLLADAAEHPDRRLSRLSLGDPEEEARRRARRAGGLRGARRRAAGDPHDDEVGTRAPADPASLISNRSH